MSKSSKQEPSSSKGFPGNGKPYLEVPDVKILAGAFKKTDKSIQWEDPAVDRSVQYEQPVEGAPQDQSISYIPHVLEDQYDEKSVSKKLSEPK